MCAWSSPTYTDVASGDITLHIISTSAHGTGTKINVEPVPKNSPNRLELRHSTETRTINNFTRAKWHHAVPINDVGDESTPSSYLLLEKPFRYPLLPAALNVFPLEERDPPEVDTSALFYQLAEQCFHLPVIPDSTLFDAHGQSVMQPIVTVSSHGSYDTLNKTASHSFAHPTDSFLSQSSLQQTHPGPEIASGSVQNGSKCPASP